MRTYLYIYIYTHNIYDPTPKYYNPYYGEPQQGAPQSCCNAKAYLLRLQLDWPILCTHAYQGRRQKASEPAQNLYAFYRTWDLGFRVQGFRNNLDNPDI